MAMRVVKSEPATEEEEESWAVPSPPLASLADEATADLPPMDLDTDNMLPTTTSGVVNEEEEDVIVREIDVFLSPELSQQLYLLQFPLQQQPSASQSGLRTTRRDKPQAARIKPRHCMIELDYSIRQDQNDDGGDHEFRGQFYIAKRTFSSQTIPVSTHMALGKLVTATEEGGSNAATTRTPPGLHLVPLTRITQMRPNFQHVDEANLLMASTTGSEDQEDPDVVPSATTSDGRRPLTFQKKESERAALARKSSYAYKKASEESEVWIPLEVHAEHTLESERKLEEVACPTPHQNLVLGELTNGQDAAAPWTDSTDSMTPVLPVSSNQQVFPGRQSTTSASSLSASYIQSLNYLPPTQAAGSTIQLETDDGAPRDQASVVVGRLVELMQLGWPMPFAVLRNRFDAATYWDDTLIQGLNTCAILVRGNFVLQSRLLPLPAAVGHARTFLLFLFHTLEVVYRARLEHVYYGDNQVTTEVILMLLEQLGTRTSEGWKLKVDDDPTFPAKYPAVAGLHLEYWQKQVRRFGPLFERYGQEPQQNGGS